MTLEEAKLNIEISIKSPLFGRKNCVVSIEAIDTVLKALEDSIPKEKVRDLINSYTHDMKLCDNTDMFEAVESDIYEFVVDNLKELLGE